MTADPNADFEVIADNIEDMQIAWGCDADNDGIIEEDPAPGNRNNDEWVGNYAGGTDNVRSIARLQTRTRSRCESR
jgi:hypothetical protein